MAGAKGAGRPPGGARGPGGGQGGRFEAGRQVWPDLSRTSGALPLLERWLGPWLSPFPARKVGSSAKRRPGRAAFPRRGLSRSAPADTRPTCGVRTGSAGRNWGLGSRSVGRTYPGSPPNPGCVGEPQGHKFESRAPRTPYPLGPPFCSPAAPCPPPRAAPGWTLPLSGQAESRPHHPAPIPTPCSQQLAAKRSALQRPQRRPANFVPSGTEAILAKFVRHSTLPTCAGEAPTRAAWAPRPRGAASSPGRTGSRRRPRPLPWSLRLLGGGRGLGAPGRARDLAYLRWRPAAPGRGRGLCGAARRARSGGEQATTNGDISRRSTWRAERAGVPRRRGRQPSPHRRDVGEQARCSHPAAH